MVCIHITLRDAIATVLSEGGKFRKVARDFPDGPVIKYLPCNVENTGLIPGQGTKIARARE